MQRLRTIDPRGRVVFFVPRWTTESTPERQGTPFRAFTVIGALIAAGYEVCFVTHEQDFDGGRFPAGLRDYAAQADIAVICMNELDPMVQTLSSLQFSRAMREMAPRVKIVVTGEFITLCPPELLRLDGPVDYWIRGYAEESVIALIEAIRGSRSHATVPGLVWRDGDVWSDNPPAARVPLSREFLEPFRLLDLNEFVQTGGIFGNDQRTLVIGTGSGCAKRCAFCYWANHRPRLVDAESIVDIVMDLRQRYDVRQFHFADLDFFTQKKRSMRVAELFAEREADVLWFTLGSPIDMIELQRQDWELLARGGLRKIELGTESGSERMLRHIGKRHTPPQVLEITKIALEHGMHVMHNFIFGFPTERPEDRRDSLQLILRLFDLDSERVTFTFRFFQPAWNTALGDEALTHAPDWPKTLETFVAARPAFGSEDERSMPWQSEADEALIKRWVYHDLPLITDRRAPDRAWRGALRSVLQRRARSRIAKMRAPSRVDRWMFDRCLGHRLDNTYIP